MGMPDLKSIRDRCIEFGECWLWAHSLNSGGHPEAGHLGRSMLVRRRAFELSRGYLPDPRKRAISTHCHETLCCNPDHMVDLSRSALIRSAHERNPRNTATHYRAYLQGRIKCGGTKLSFDLARQVRADTRPARVLAAELDVSTSLIVQIRRGDIWREFAPNSSVFNRRA